MTILFSLMETEQQPPELAAYLKIRRMLMDQLRQCNNDDCANAISSALIKLKTQYLKASTKLESPGVVSEAAIDDSVALEFSQNIANPTISSKAKVYGYMCAAFDGVDNKKCMHGAANKLLIDLNSVPKEEPGIPETAEYLTNYISQAESELGAK